MKEILLMWDETQEWGKDGKAEVVMDYIISYTLRSAMNAELPIFQEYARRILFKLLDLQEEGQIIKSIKVWKQWNYVDLWVEVIIESNGQNEQYAILIEDKYYSGLHDNQLKRYKEIFDNHYANKSGWQLRYVIITAQYRDTAIFNSQFGEVEKEGIFKVYPLNELVSFVSSPSESDIFNQFWLSDWH